MKKERIRRSRRKRIRGGMRGLKIRRRRRRVGRMGRRRTVRRRMRGRMFEFHSGEGSGNGGLCGGEEREGERGRGEERGRGGEFILT